PWEDRICARGSSDGYEATRLGRWAGKYQVEAENSDGNKPFERRISHKSPEDIKMDLIKDLILGRVDRKWKTKE
ncbi:MAG: hypothetical protein WBK76_02040, partial [Candidatus Saccharimonadales bacterium]